MENFEKDNDDSLDDVFLKTLEKNDIDFLRKSLMKFNMKDNFSNQNSKKYNVKIRKYLIIKKHPCHTRQSMFSVLFKFIFSNTKKRK